MRQSSICECFGNIGQKTDAWIIRGPKFLPPIIRRNINQFNAVHGDEPNESPRKWNNQTPEAHFKSSTSPPNTIPVVSGIMGILNHHAIHNGDVEVCPSYFPVEFNSEYIPDLYTTLIKSIDDDEMDHLLDFSLRTWWRSSKFWHMDASVLTGGRPSFKIL